MNGAPSGPAPPAGAYGVAFDVDRLAEQIAQRVAELIDLASLTGEFEMALVKQAAEERKRVQELISLALPRTGSGRS